MPALISAVEAKCKKYWGGNIRGVHFISLLKRTGLDELRRAIVETASKLLWYVSGVFTRFNFFVFFICMPFFLLFFSSSFRSLQVPAYYLTLKQLLMELKAEAKDYTRFAVFETRARERLGHLADEQKLSVCELRTALVFFADCGLVLYFDTAGLRETIILDPNWLAGVMST